MSFPLFHSASRPLSVFSLSAFVSLFPAFGLCQHLARGQENLPLSSGAAVYAEALTICPRQILSASDISSFYLNIFIFILMFILILMLLLILMLIFMYPRAYTCLFARMYLCLYFCMFLIVYLYFSMFLYIFLYFSMSFYPSPYLSFF